MKNYIERNNFVPRNTFWKWLLHVLKCVWKGGLKNVTFKQQKLYEEVTLQIVATNVLAYFRVVTHSYSASLSRKVVLCGTKNVFYSLGNSVWCKMNNMFWNCINNNGKVIELLLLNCKFSATYCLLY